MVLAASPARAAAAFGLPVHRLRSAIKHNEIAARRVGVRILVELDDVRDWLRAQPLAYQEKSHGA
jgi:hypothetical protein